MASGDAGPVPKKNAAYRISFPVFDNDGDLVTGASSLDSEVSKDGGAFTDVTPGEATEIASSSGIYYLDLSADEMNADTVCVIVKTTSTDAKTTPIILYPEEAGDIRVDVTQLGSATQSATDLKDFADAGYDPATNKIQGLVLADTCTTNTDMRGTDSGATAAALATVDAIVDSILVDTGTTLDGKITTVDTVVDSILADTGTDGVVLTAATCNKIADHILRRTFAEANASSDGSSVIFRSLMGVVAKLTNKISVAGATLSVYEEDDSTVLGQQALTTDSAADPITAADTV